MGKETCDITTKEEAILFLLRHNPGVLSLKYYHMNQEYLVSSEPVEKLFFPEGWYYSEKNGITNKHYTTSGIYQTIDIVFA